MLSRIYHAIRNRFRSDDEKWAEAREVAYQIRDMARERLGVDLSDEEIELHFRFHRALDRARRKHRDFDEYMVTQLYCYLTPDRRRQIVAEMEASQ